AGLVQMAHEVGRYAVVVQRDQVARIDRAFPLGNDLTNELRIDAVVLQFDRGARWQLRATGPQRLEQRNLHAVIFHLGDLFDGRPRRKEACQFAEIVAIHSVIAELDHVPNGLDAVAGGAKFAGRRKTEVVRGEVEELIVADVAKADGPEIGEEARIGLKLHRPGPDTERKRAFAAERAGVPPNAERSRAP